MSIKRKKEKFWWYILSNPWIFVSSIFLYALQTISFLFFKKNEINVFTRQTDIILFVALPTLLFLFTYYSIIFNQKQLLKYVSKQCNFQFKSTVKYANWQYVPLFGFFYRFFLPTKVEKEVNNVSSKIDDKQHNIIRNKFECHTGVTNLVFIACGWWFPYSLFLKYYQDIDYTFWIIINSIMSLVIVVAMIICIVKSFKVTKNKLVFLYFVPIVWYFVPVFLKRYK